MKRFLTGAVSLSVLAGLAAGQSCDALKPGFDDIDGCGKAAALRLRYKLGLPVWDGKPAGSFESRDALDDTDVLSNDLDIEIDPAAATITGSNTMRVRVVQGPLTQFTFMLRSQYAITSATINGGTGVAVSGPPANSYARVTTLDRAYAAGEEFTLRIAYTGTAVSVGFGSIEFGTQPGSSNPIVASLSEAYYAATWWPVKDGNVFLPGDNADKATLRLAVTAPSTLRTVSNGVLESVTDLPGNKRKYQWSSNYPISTYLVCFSSSVYNTYTVNYSYPLPGGGTGAMPVELNLYPGSDNAGNRNAWSQCTQMMATYRPIYGEYPFVSEKYGIYQFPFGGGMEHQTNTGQGTFSESVTAHELGHQWWGDNVTCRYWNDIWLNEGFATYTEALWLERKPGSTGLPALYAAMDARRPSAVNDSVYCYDVTNMNRIFSTNFTYRKAGWVLHMLRRVVGDSTFFETLATYRSRFQGSAATTDDFAQAATDTFVSHDGYDLSNFFQQWVYGIGAPAYAYGWQGVTIAGQPYMRLSLRQTQNNTWGSGGVFTMPVDVRVNMPAGPQTVTVQNSARTQHYLIPIAQSPTGMVLDENNWILATDKVAESYQNGPPKLVAATPAVGASMDAAEYTGQVFLTFSENVNIAAANVTITGPGGAAPATLSYNPAAGVWRATLTTGALPAGDYTVSVSPGVTSVAAGIGLDGEITNGLPSGDGLPGGAATFAFRLTAPCPADFNHSGGTPDDADVAAFFDAWNAGDASADLNASGGTPDDADVSYFFMRWSAGC